LAVAAGGNSLQTASLIPLGDLAPVSIEEYLAGEAMSDVKHEFIGGLVFEMNGFSNLHNTISVNSLVCLHS
jgi:hypothetical protein